MTWFDKINPYAQAGYPRVEQPKENPYGQFGTLTAPNVEPARTNNEYGISIPKNYSYVPSEDGSTKIATGNDGVGLAHKDPNECKFWVA